MQKAFTDLNFFSFINLVFKWRNYSLKDILVSYDLDMFHLKHNLLSLKNVLFVSRLFAPQAAYHGQMT